MAQSGHAIEGRSPSDRDVSELCFLYQVPDKGLAGQSCRASCSPEPAAPRSQVHPYAMLATGNMQSLSLQMPCYGRGRERQRCPPGAQSHDLGLFLANHWLPSQRPSRQKAQASTRPAGHFLTLSEDPRTRKGYRQRERTEGAATSNQKVDDVYTPMLPAKHLAARGFRQSWSQPWGTDGK